MRFRKNVAEYNKCSIAGTYIKSFSAVEIFKYNSKDYLCWQIKRIFNWEWMNFDDSLLSCKCSNGKLIGFSGIKSWKMPDSEISNEWTCLGFGTAESSILQKDLFMYPDHLEFHFLWSIKQGNLNFKEYNFY